MGRHLHFKIFAIFLLSFFIAVPVTFLVLGIGDERHEASEYMKAIASLIAKDTLSLPERERKHKIKMLGEKMRLRFAYYDSNGNMIAGTLHAPILPKKRRQEGIVFHTRQGMAIAFPIDNKRWVTASHAGKRKSHFLNVSLGVIVFTSLLGGGAYFAARRVTGRLERLQSAVSDWGGAESPRPVVIEGRDEVARLAQSFNDAGERIKSLLDQQRNLLASASHELRTPLARIGVAAELLSQSKDETKREKTLAGIHDDIKELDGLVEEILLAARLDAHPVRDEETEEIDLFALAKQSAEAFDATVDGEAVNISGHRKMIKRLIVNLLDNAKKYAGGGAKITVSSDGGERSPGGGGFWPGSEYGRSRRYF